MQSQNRAADDAIVRFDGVGFGYRRCSPALFSGLDLRLPAGTVCGLLGANGAGKSTLLRLIAGLSFPQQGRCLVMGHEPKLRHPDFLADVLLLPEQFQLPTLSAGSYAGRYGALYPRFDREQFRKLLGDMQIDPRQRLDRLSHGQGKKFLIAFGLATQARLLILDEPTNGLDIPAKALLRRLLIDHYQPDRSILVSTHQVHDLQGLVDSVIVLDRGDILLHETLETLESRLQVTVEHSPPIEALYSERTIEGFRVIRRNNGTRQSRLDLDLMFGLVSSNRTLFDEIMRPGADA